MPYIAGDTVWLRCTFYNRSGVAEDRTSVALKIYDAGRTQIGTTITTISHVGTGIYEYAYTLPVNFNKVIYEFSGLDGDSKTQVCRYELDNIWTGDESTVTAQTVDTVTALSTQITDHIADTSDAHDASAISVTDEGDVFTGTNVQTILEELEARIKAVEDAMPS